MYDDLIFLTILPVTWLVLKFTTVAMKSVLARARRMSFQFVVACPSTYTTASSVSFTAAGGDAMARTSSRCAFLMPCTALRASASMGSTASRSF